MKNALLIIKYLVLIGFLIVIFIDADIIRFSINAKPKKSDIILVLGCQVNGTTPSPFLQTRLNEGIRFYKKVMENIL